MHVLSNQSLFKVSIRCVLSRLWHDALSSRERSLQDLDLLEHIFLKDILSRTDCTTTLTDLRTKFENAFHSEFEEHAMQESKIDTGKALDADLVDTESIRTDSTVQDDSSRSGNDTDADESRYQTHYDEAKG
ncbi:hypothetical protein Tco_0684538 [Tanacetum coccineum]